MKLALLTCSLVLCVSATASAKAAPAQLLGKSVVVSWTEDRLQRLGGMGEFVGKSVSNQLSAYISTEGRVFVRRVVIAIGKRGQPRSGGVSSVGAGADNHRGQKAALSGRTLIVTNQFEGGVRRAQVEFNADFSSCTAHVILGRESGTATARGRSLTSGQKLEIKEAHVTNITCSVQQGNVFGQ